MAHTHLPGKATRIKATVLALVAVAAGAGALMGLDASISSAASPVTSPVGATSLSANVARPSSAHGPVDIGFAQDMSLHHEQALTLARIALVKGSATVRALAQGIVHQQLKEIGTLQGWLMLWSAPPVSESDDMTWMRDAYARSRQRDPAYDQFIDSCIQGQGMPGLATPEQVASLENAASAHLADRQFLALMIRHHQGAIVMARFTADHAHLGAVRDFARSVAFEQQQEMTTMVTLLKAKAM